VVLKHSSMINGYDTFNLTKVDVLDELKEIKVGTAYVGEDGEELDGFPGSFYFPFSSLRSSIHPSPPNKLTSISFTAFPSPTRPSPAGAHPSRRSNHTKIYPRIVRNILRL
jgi:hypothetical protein